MSEHIELYSHTCECTNCGYSGCEHNPNDEEERKECEEEKEEYYRCGSECETCNGEGVIHWWWQVDDNSDCDFCKKENVDIQIFHNSPQGERCVCEECYIGWHKNHAKENGCKEWEEETNEPDTGTVCSSDEQARKSYIIQRYEELSTEAKINIGRLLGMRGPSEDIAELSAHMMHGLADLQNMLAEFWCLVESQHYEGVITNVYSTWKEQREIIKELIHTMHKEQMSPTSIKLMKNLLWHICELEDIK